MPGISILPPRLDTDQRIPKSAGRASDLLHENAMAILEPQLLTARVRATCTPLVMFDDVDDITDHTHILIVGSSIGAVELKTILLTLALLFEGENTAEEPVVLLLSLVRCLSQAIE